MLFAEYRLSRRSNSGKIGVGSSKTSSRKKKKKRRGKKGREESLDL